MLEAAYVATLVTSVLGPAGCRGGGKSGDHVDVLANHGLLDILLSVASGNYDEVQDRVISEIDSIAANVDFD